MASKEEGKKAGKGSFANMPQEVSMKAYPKSAKLRGGAIDDTMTGIDKTNNASESKVQRRLSNQH